MIDLLNHAWTDTKQYCPHLRILWKLSTPVYVTFLRLSQNYLAHPHQLSPQLDGWTKYVRCHEAEVQFFQEITEILKKHATISISQYLSDSPSRWKEIGIGKENQRTNGSFLSLDATYKINCHNNKLLQFTGLAPTYQPIPITYSFLSNENVDQFSFGLRQLRKHVAQDPLCVTTDKDAALRSSLRTVFPHTKLFLCRWHALNSIYGKARDFYDHETSEDIKEMCGKWMHADTIEKCEKT
ncbi:putative MULE transposase domain containing protein [Blattamonas nauphoetae]|uniref:MULE transposase domain containing protein n=1 Tax=Blattamonas nauphoetae TaxID=2049346 RepID=A0ABQ9WQG3_9EUKA|nr:putative MULE transposase domain containing protein [Blattamonas nauphoetae]